MPARSCPAAWARAAATLSSPYVWPRPPLLRCERDQTGLLNPTASAHPNIAASWNIAPTDQLLVVRYDTKAGERRLDVMRWGLVPYWAKDIKVGFANINAKAEGIESKPAFREAFQRRRCLVPVDNFFEWKKTATGKQPYAVAFADRSLMALAGLWENWRSPAGEWIRSFAIVTTTPNELCAELHNRMPVVVGRDAWPVGSVRSRGGRANSKPFSRPTPRAG